jgi:LuxR family maltose regulon positive regulatory protein
MVPLPRWRPVARRRLFGLLDEGTRGPLTLVAAPAGYGKTLLLASWAAGAGPPGPVAWVRAGPGDHHPPRFWAQVLAALREAEVAPPDGPLAGLDPPPAEIGDGFLQAFAGGLSELRRPLVLIVDDLHEAAGQAVEGQLRLLLRQAPPQLRLVVASRADPALGLHRLRVAGQLGEIREAELAFTLEEAAALLADQGVELSGGELETLWRRTEGWAAGLRLAALSLRGHPQPGRFVADLAGDDRAIAGYLVEEVLAAQPPELRAFLLRTAVADRLCGVLADALTGGSDGARVLARLERGHVFTSAAGPSRTWYRYHPLFAELLRAELRHEHAGELPGLHRRAAAWFAGNGRPVEAVRHALAAGDAELAAELLATGWAPILADGRAAVLADLVLQLPGERVRTSPELAVVAALSRLALGELEEADAWLGLASAAEPRFAAAAAAGGAGRPRPPGPPPRRAGAALGLARLYRARLVGDVAEAGPARLLPVTTGGAAPWGGDADDQRTLAATLLGATQLWSGQLEEAAATLERARADADRTGRQPLAVAVTGHLALLEAVRGRLGRAGELGRLAVERARSSGWSASSRLASADLAMAVVAYHRDDLDAASAALQRATRSAVPGDRPVRLAAAVLAARMAAGPGRNGAEGTLARLDAALAATGGRPPRLLAAAATAARAKLLAAAGDEEAAVAALGGTGGTPSPAAAVVLARLQVAGGDPAAALRTLAPLLAVAPGGAPPELPLAIEAFLLDAVANQELADHAAAAGALLRALDLAGPEGYYRVFVEGGMPVRLLLADQLHRDTNNHHQLVAALLERFRAAAARGGPANGRPAAPAPLVVPLSDREQVVLRYLSSRLSAGEIADELYVSLNTVKTHIKSIYRKLDTNRRWDAVKRARQLQLL